jgi:hypothetical protein
MRVPASFVGRSLSNVAPSGLAHPPPNARVVLARPKVHGPRVRIVQTAREPGRLKSGVGVPRPSGPVGKVRKLFDEVAKLPRRQQEKIVEFLAPIIEDFKRKAG